MEILNKDEKDIYLEELGKRAREAEKLLRVMPTEIKNKALLKVAEVLLKESESILLENEKDVNKARENGMKESLIDRLKLTAQRIEGMADGIRQVAELSDPVGIIREEFERPNGLKLQKVSVPMGVIGIIYESRPNVTADAFALCFKSGNVSFLKGGSDALYSNRAIVAAIRKGLSEAGISEDAVIFIDRTEREVTTKFMRLREYVDLLIPRGGAGLIRATVENSSIPVIETGTGNCHVYVDKAADIDMAVKIIHNAKTQRMGVCNACESLVIHSKIADKAVKAIYEDLSQKAIEMRADDRARAIVSDMKEATIEDFATEYGDAIISVKIVDSLTEAIDHINRYTTHHSECIVTADSDAAERFMNEIDAACVYHNASTRFTDGFEFGFGAEIGISTQKLHARGPMGLRELTSYKYKVLGEGQIRG